MEVIDTERKNNAKTTSICFTGILHVLNITYVNDDYNYNVNHMKYL